MRYPKPIECGHDNGPKFTGHEFQELLDSYGIKSKPTTVKNPTAQSLVERIHLTLGDYLRTAVFSEDVWKDDVDMLIQSCAWAIRATALSNAPYTPGQLAFRHDMIFCQKCLVDWTRLKQRRQRQAIENNKKENKNRREHNYKVGDLVLIIEK